MKTCKNYIEMQAENMSKYLEETVVNSVSWISWNLQLKLELQWVKVSNDFYFLLFIEKISNI